MGLHYISMETRQTSLKQNAQCSGNTNNNNNFFISDNSPYGYNSGMRLGFGKNSGKFYIAIDSNPNNTIGSSYLR